MQFQASPPIYGTIENDNFTMHALWLNFHNEQWDKALSQYKEIKSEDFDIHYVPKNAFLFSLEKTLLIMAVRAGQIEWVRRLLLDQSPTSDAVDQKDRTGADALAWAYAMHSQTEGLAKERFQEIIDLIVTHKKSFSKEGKIDHGTQLELNIAKNLLKNSKPFRANVLEYLRQYIQKAHDVNKKKRAKQVKIAGWFSFSFGLGLVLTGIAYAYLYLKLQQIIAQAYIAWLTTGTTTYATTISSLIIANYALMGVFGAGFLLALGLYIYYCAKHRQLENHPPTLSKIVLKGFEPVESHAKEQNISPVLKLGEKGLQPKNERSKKHHKNQIHKNTSLIPRLN